MIEFIFYGSIAVVDPRTVTPHRDEPGCFGDQVDAIAGYLADPARKIDRMAAWQAARRLNMEHVRAADRRERERRGAS